MFSMNTIAFMLLDPQNWKQFQIFVLVGADEPNTYFLLRFIASTDIARFS